MCSKHWQSTAFLRVRILNDCNDSGEGYFGQADCLPVDLPDATWQNFFAPRISQRTALAARLWSSHGAGVDSHEGRYTPRSHALHAGRGEAGREVPCPPRVLAVPQG